MRFIIPAILVSIFSATSIVHAQENSLLWEISGNGIKESSYLFGTIHMIGKNDFFVRDEVDSVFAKCDQVAFEIDLDDTSQLQTINQWVILPEGNTLQQLTTPDQFEVMQKYFMDSLSIDILQMNNLKPFVLYQQLLTSFIEGEQASFELYFLQKSIQQQKGIIGLEPISDEFKVFDHIPFDEQIQWVMDGIDSAVYYQSEWDRLVDVYQSEDLIALQKMMHEDSPEIEKYEDAFLTDRNQNWVIQIQKLTKQMPTFIAVGAAHLPGENGLISLLKAKGFTVKPILQN